MQFGDAVAHADDARPQAPKPEKIGHAGHEALVERGHELDDTLPPHACHGKGLGLVEGEPLQVGIGAGKGDRLARGAGSGDVVDDVGAVAADEVVVEALEVLLLGEGQAREVVEGAHLSRVDAVLGKQAAVEGRAFGEIGHLPVQKVFLESADGGRRLKFDVERLHGQKVRGGKGEEQRRKSAVERMGRTRSVVV